MIKTSLKETVKQHKIIQNIMQQLKTLSMQALNKGAPQGVKRHSKLLMFYIIMDDYNID